MHKRIVTVAFLLACLPWAAPGRAETPAERGAYLVNGIGSCGNCHSEQAPDGSVIGPPLAGGGPMRTRLFTAYAPNLTSDPDTGLGKWTEDQIVTAMRYGFRPDGRLVRPPMPVTMYRFMSDRDVRAVAAYLKSLPPVVNPLPESTYHAPLPANYGGPVTHVPDPDPNDPVATGAYLVRMGHCMICHTPAAADGRRDYATRLGAGGVVMSGNYGTRVTSNITPDRETGIGAWTDDQIRAALTQGTRPDGSRLTAPMPWRYLARMTRADLDAVVAYLRSIPAVRYKVE